ncbi:Phage integrase family protein [Alkalithermobacter thermoalcaliphilus JW-YL-7 = DSM 7308]|uniref:Integrase family protein n=1 Tax=Alkalithermobacter thermoalcaliphilus JW-YL-7 = DSM 7308 TaxID=1121328 RepID=A0A150FQL7_CLOPD|nr:integrase family protein [[Clostridium] paradoxum JW-YL-7 = DSM 7308]SHK49575.1 Phage integrase family protein [[Clostridium] paradoxum JW-YL-7 = DSM 7308]
MRTVSPIKDLKHIEILKLYFKNKNLRDYLLFIFGINTNLRIGDLLNLKLEDVYNGKKIREYIELKEQKTNKLRKIPINENMRKALKEYMKEEKLRMEDYLFRSKKGKNKPITRQQAHYILSKGGEWCGIEEPISPHSLRKTWGYWAWKTGTNPMLIMEGLNHSSLTITKRYIGVMQEELNKVFINLNL